LTLRACKNCGKLIDLLYGGGPRIYCNKKCLEEYHIKYKKNRYREKHPLKNNTCLTCNRLIICTKYNGKKYCSELCYPTRLNWCKIQKFERLKKELNDIGYKTQTNPLQKRTRK